MRVFGHSIKDTGIAKFSVRERERETFKEQMSERERESKSEDWALALFIGKRPGEPVLSSLLLAMSGFGFYF